MKNKVLSISLSMALAAGALSVGTYAAWYEWKEENGKLYWYENGVKQGVAGDPKNLTDEIYGIERGREIYDPDSDAWYWLDANANGAKAESKDVWLPYVYQNETPGSTEGKWVRYDENGHMVKGVQLYEKNQSWYQFDVITGAMIKGWFTTKSGNDVYYDAVTGILKENDFTLPGLKLEVDYDTGHITKTVLTKPISYYGRSADASVKNDWTLAELSVVKYLSNASYTPKEYDAIRQAETQEGTFARLQTQFGIQAETEKEERLASRLRHGDLVILFTDRGTFAPKDNPRNAILLYGYDNGAVNVYDPEDAGRNGVYKLEDCLECVNLAEILPNVVYSK